VFVACLDLAGGISHVVLNGTVLRPSAFSQQRRRPRSHFAIAVGCQARKFSLMIQIQLHPSLTHFAWLITFFVQCSDK
jgi:hypothetical protein